MNKHFEDARYYLKRAGETAGRGVKEELKPIEDRFRDLTGTESEPAPSGLDAIKTDLRALQERAEGEAEQALANARAKIGDYRHTAQPEA